MNAHEEEVAKLLRSISARIGILVAFLVVLPLIVGVIAGIVVLSKSMAAKDREKAEAELRAVFDDNFIKTSKGLERAAAGLEEADTLLMRAELMDVKDERERAKIIEKYHEKYLGQHKQEDSSHSGRVSEWIEPIPLETPAPPYPSLSRRDGEQGSVLCRLHLSREGLVTQVDVIESSGFERLDAAAHDALLRWRFEPRRVSGKPATATIEHRVSFRPSEQK